MRIPNQLTPSPISALHTNPDPFPFATNRLTFSKGRIVSTLVPSRLGVRAALRADGLVDGPHALAVGPHFFDNRQEDYGTGVSFFSRCAVR